jgi:hypothetical protein
MKEKNIYCDDIGYRKTKPIYGVIYKGSYCSNDELIGLMTQWLLDKGLFLVKDIEKQSYLIATTELYDNKALAENALLYDCLVEAINSIGADNAN